MVIYQEASQLLGDALSALDLTHEMSEKAVEEYGEVAAWLGAPNSPLRPFSPQLYAQGSFRLGTPVRPFGREDEFDVDLVCVLDIPKEKTTQRDLKAAVGDRLKAHEDYKNRLAESRRCWTLSYKPDFHLDVLPSIPDPATPADGILLTDRDLTRWQYSNPIGYSDWFFERMEPVLTEALQKRADDWSVSIEEVPRWSVRTPLQRAVQLLKRHRDVRFQQDPENRPVSIIITTLAGRACRATGDLTGTVLDLAERMPSFIERRNGTWWVPNPAQEAENFADKWNEYPERRDAFLRWLEALRADLDQVTGAASTEDAFRLLNEQLGARPPAAVPGSSASPSLVVAVPGEDLSHAKPPEWPEDLRYRCEINAYVHRGIRVGPRSPLPMIQRKGVGLEFVAKTSAAKPYTIRWQVINTGWQAQKAGQLRGGFYPCYDDADQVRWESTKYAGRHFVEAFVIKDGRVVARSGRFPVRIST